MEISQYMTPEKKGLLLLNLGSPDSPEVKDVKPYLREFLMDPYVIDIPFWKRFLLINGIIVPFRAPKSSKAYKKVWTKEGSPLIIYTENLTKKVKEMVSEKWHVEMAMRYQNPSLKSALEKFKRAGINDLHVLPLYPQYALSSTESCRAKLMQDLEKLSYRPKLHFKEYFYNEPEYLDLYASNINKAVKEFKADALLYSYHGVPERHVTKTDPTGEHCLKCENCCEKVTKANEYCYRAHCLRTTKALEERLDLGIPHKISFQSRLGKDPWIKPYTDIVAPDWAKEGVKRLAVASPAFVADCLETLEELAMELKEEFIEAGGEDLLLIPSLNDTDEWAEVITGWTQSAKV